VQQNKGIHCRCWNGIVSLQEGGLVIKIRRTNCSKLPNDRA